MKRKEFIKLSVGAAVAFSAGMQVCHDETIDEFTERTLEQALNDIRKYKDDRGLRLSLMPTKLYIFQDQM